MKSRRPPRRGAPSFLGREGFVLLSLGPRAFRSSGSPWPLFLLVLFRTKGVLSNFFRRAESKAFLPWNRHIIRFYVSVARGGPGPSESIRFLPSSEATRSEGERRRSRKAEGPKAGAAAGDPSPTLGAERARRRVGGRGLTWHSGCVLGETETNRTTSFPIKAESRVHDSSPSSVASSLAIEEGTKSGSKTKANNSQQRISWLSQR